jgi:hypothetical protein
LREQIKAARPVEFLIKVAEGRRIRIGPQAGPDKPTYAYPTVEQRIRVAELLVKEILPDLTANEVTGPGGKDLIPAEPGLSDLQLAQWIAFLLAKGGRGLPVPNSEPSALNPSPPADTAGAPAVSNPQRAGEGSRAAAEQPDDSGRGVKASPVVDRPADGPASVAR